VELGNTVAKTELKALPFPPEDKVTF